MKINKLSLQFASHQFYLVVLKKKLTDNLKDNLNRSETYIPLIN